MKSISNMHKNIATFVALFFLSIPMFFQILWQYAFKLGSTQSERVEIFHSYLPMFLHVYNRISLLSIFFSILAIICSIIGMRRANIFIKILNILIIFISSLLVLLNLFGMM